MSAAPVWQCSEQELPVELGALEIQSHATWAQILAGSRKSIPEGIAAAKGYSTTVELVRAVARVPRSEARSRIAAAAVVLHHWRFAGHQRRGRASPRLRRRSHPHRAGQTRRTARREPTSRTVPAAIRRAVNVRDGGCAFPGCAVPARWCVIHHCIHWADHGHTSVDNCVARCGRHHRLMHHSNWRIEMTGGIPQFPPLPWLGGQARRNPLHTASELIRIRE